MGLNMDDTTRIPRNELEEMRRDASIMPIEVAAEIYAGPGAIEAQEARGQREILNSTVIPISGSEGEAGERLVALGFKLGDKKDDLFRQAELPEGWEREGSDHSMWSYIVDERGFRRCAIFYKGAFYDREASITIISEPVTKAQDDAYAAFREGRSRSDGWTMVDGMIGETKIYLAGEMAIGDDGRPIYCHSYQRDGEWIGGDWEMTGLVFEQHVAPDGTVIYEAEYRI